MYMWHLYIGSDYIDVIFLEFKICVVVLSWFSNYLKSLEIFIKPVEHLDWFLLLINVLIMQKIYVISSKYNWMFVITNIISLWLLL